MAPKQIHELDALGVSPAADDKLPLSDADGPNTTTYVRVDELLATAHTHTAAQLSDSTAAGRTLLTAANAAAQRTALNVEDGAKDDQTGAEIKALYEAEADTNAYTDAEQSKLASVEASATADQTSAEIRAGYDAEVAQVSQVEAEAGTVTADRRWTPERVKQAVVALAPGGSGEANTARSDGAGASIVGAKDGTVLPFRSLAAGTNMTVTVNGDVVELDAAIPATLVLQGDWNADTNTPTLVSSTGTEGHAYVVGVDGSTTLDGISSWVAGDTVFFAGGTWHKAASSTFSHLTTFKVVGDETGGVARSILARSQERPISVKEFGATGDGVTDDRLAIQRTIDFVAGQGGGTVLVPKGEYYTALTTDTQDNYALKITGNNITLLFQEGAHVFIDVQTSADYAIILCRERNNILLLGHGATLTGDKDLVGQSYGGLEFGHGIVIAGCDNVAVHGFKVESVAGDGVVWSGSAAGGANSYAGIENSTRITVQNVWVHRGARSAFSPLQCATWWMDNCLATETDGTSPECACDVEPNQDTNLNEEGFISNFVSRDSTGVGMSITAFAFNTADRHNYSVRVVGHESIRDANGLRINQLGGDKTAYPGNASDYKMIGRIVYSDFVIRDSGWAGLLIEEVLADLSPHTTISNGRIIWPNKLDSSNRLRGAAIVVYRDTSGATDAKMGEVVIDKVSYEMWPGVTGAPEQHEPVVVWDKLASPAGFKGLQINVDRACSDNGKPYWYVAGGDLDVEFTGLGCNRGSYTADATLDGTAYYRTVDNTGAAGLVTLTLGTTYGAASPKITFEVTAAQSLRIAPPSGESLLPLGTTDQYLEASTIGARLTLQRKGGNWLVVEQIGTWSAGP